MIHTAYQVLCGDQTKRDKMGGEYGTCGGERKCRQDWWGNLGEGDNLVDLSVDVDNIKIHLKEIGWEDID